MTHFYRQLLDRSAEQHSATVAATQGTPKIGPAPPAEQQQNLTIVKPPTLPAKPDAELALIAREKGQDVELNDDNQIVDKRDLLSAGLNLSAPNTRRLGLSLIQKKADGDAVETHRAAGVAASKKEIRERQARLIEQQLVEEEERTRQRREQEEAEERERVVKRRNNE